MKYQVGAVAGKFRIFHQAHEELIIKASQMCEKLIIFVCDEPHHQRYISINDLVECIKLFAKEAKINYQIVTLSQIELKHVTSLKSWDLLLLSKVNDLQVVFDSKEKYGNDLLENEYLELGVSYDISASEIEKDLMRNKQLINKCYWQKYLTNNNYSS